MSAPEEKTVDPASLIWLLRQTRSLLAAHRAFGLSSYPATAELRGFAAARLALPSPSLSSPSPPRPVAAPERPKAASEHQPSVLKSASTEQISGCRRCTSASMPLPGIGSDAPRVVVVGDCFIGENPHSGMIWGQAEDELFWRMMGAIQLDRRTVYVTNVIKCPQNEAHNSEAMRNCLTWLEKELRLLQPQVICAMGEIAACTLTAKNAPLMRLRGTFHPCRIATDIRAQVMPTLHPRYLLGLHEPDLQKKMKAVAWQDLLLIQARLNPPH